MNSAKVLYIIGNGFDLHHGIKSKYIDFADWLKYENISLYDTVEKLILFDNNLWAKFEEDLCNLNEDTFIEICNNYQGGYDETAYFTGPIIQADLLINKLTEELQRYFRKWVNQISIPRRNSIAAEKLLELNQDAIYLSFNYTSTLEKIYSIKVEKIIHIHGKANCSDQPILGHNIVAAQNFTRTEPIAVLNAEEIANLNDQHCFHDESVEISMRSYYSKNIKQTSEIIKNNSSFFNALVGVEEIVVLGHSFGEVDFPYYQEIIKKINVQEINWRISVYNDHEKANIESAAELLNLPEENINYISFANIKSKL